MSNLIFSALSVIEPALWVAIGMLTVVFWSALVVAIIVGSRDKQLRKQAGEEAMEYQRRATAEEIEALKIKYGVCEKQVGGQ